MSLVLVVFLVLVLLGGFGGWHYSGYYGGPYFGGSIGLILLILLIFALVGYL